MRDYVLSRAISLEMAGSSPVRQLLKNWLVRRAITKLEKCDDHQLRDIGVTREDVHWVKGLPLSVNAALALEERNFMRHTNAPAETS